MYIYKTIYCFLISSHHNEQARSPEFDATISFFHRQQRIIKNSIEHIWWVLDFYDCLQITIRYRVPSQCFDSYQFAKAKTLKSLKYCSTPPKRKVKSC